MRLLITHPYYWPYVRRGVERYIHELAHYLSRRNYELKIVTSKPGRSKIIRQEEIKVYYYRQIHSPLLKHYGITPTLSFMPSSFYSLLREKSDLVHSFFYSDGFAAHLCKKFKSIRYILNITGLPNVAYFNKLPVHYYLFKKALRSASVIVVPSECAKNYLREDFKRNGIVIPGAVDTSNFFVTVDKDLDRPKVLCTAAINTAYKNIPLLVKAFELFKSKVPKAVLQLSGHVDSHSAKRLIMSVHPRIRESIHILGVSKVPNLSLLYSEAAFFVLPSINEAFGSVLVESLASGTPVVGTDSGGIPEIISNPQIGILYKPNKTDTLPTNAEDLCEAMIDALELAKDTETAYRCREHARKYDWNVVGPQFEEVYKKVLNGSR
jgi:glycosyltransferase involved in cell wall biosynthesis